MDSLDYSGLVKTYNVDHQTPDSAGTATAYLCGVKEVPDDFFRIFTRREASLRFKKMNNSLLLIGKISYSHLLNAKLRVVLAMKTPKNPREPP